MNKFTILKLVYFVVMVYLIFNTEGEVKSAVLTVNLLVIISLTYYQLKRMKEGKHLIEKETMEEGK